MRKSKKSPILSASLAVNYLFLLTFAIYAVAALTRHYANSPAPAVYRAQPVAIHGVEGGKAKPASQPAKTRVLKGENGKPSKEQKDIVATACQARFKGVEASRCYLRLLAMTFRESGYDCATVGDNGRSRGCLQIQTKLHNISVEQAEDYTFAVNWTLDRLMATGYQKDPYAAIKSHNGAGASAIAYARAVRATAKEYEALGL